MAVQRGPAEPRDPSATRAARHRIAAAFLALTGIATVTLGFSTHAAAATGWTIVTSPNPEPARSNSLSGVSCTSATFCMAVGGYDTGATYMTSQGTQPLFQTLIEHWNGTAWSIVPTPDPTTTQSADLSAVSCLSDSFCMAVGSYEGGSPDTGNAWSDKWNGSAWSVVAAPNSPKHASTALSGVSCVSAAFCMAAGSSGPLPGITGAESTVGEEWNGTSWTVVSTPDASSFSDALGGVSCTSNAFCMAVGSTAATFGGNTQTLGEKWSGAAWSIVATPDPTTTHPDFLSDVSCSGTTVFCMASGTYSNGSVVLSLIVRWNGTSWSTLTSPNVSGAQHTGTGSVSCTGEQLCVAAGSSSSPTRTLVEQWPGTAWSIVPSQNAANGARSALDHVSCATTSFCAAVGSSQAAPPASRPIDTLIELGPASAAGSTPVPSTGAGPSPFPTVLLFGTGLVLVACSLGAVAVQRRR